jgi:large subunit ribosomal protein L22
MNQATAILNNHRQSPRKVRVVADLVRGKDVKVASDSLAFAGKKAGEPLRRLLQSAIANAKNLNFNTDHLFVKEISVNAGKIMYRRQPMARGRAFPLRKRVSTIKIVLEERQPKKTKKEKMAAKTATKEK